MRHQITIILIHILSILTQTPPKRGEKKLVWSDEFEGTELNKTIWTHEVYKYNNLTFYTDRPENSYVENSILHIKAMREDYGGVTYTSARIKTEKKYEFQFGVVEARMALPSAKGIWPALWMMGHNYSEVDWPKCGEIDIMEAINDENKVYGTMHWDLDGHIQFGTYSNTFDITQFHNYTLEWDDKFVKCSVDGMLYFIFTVHNQFMKTKAFFQPFFFLVNVAVGGDWPGYVVEEEAFPLEMQVDYIRVYQYES